MERRHERIAGGLLIFGTLWTVITIHIAETLTPAYSVWGEAISGLGSTYFATHACFLAHCNTIYQPASLIFVSSEMLGGVLLFLAAYYLSRAPERKPISRMIALMGLGTLVLGFSYIPLYAGGTDANFTLALVPHLASSIFLVGVGALLALRADAFAEPRLKYISRVLGAIVVAAIPLYASMFTTDSLWGPGFGGVERIGFYIIFLWFLGYGVYLMTTDSNRLVV